MRINNGVYPAVYIDKYFNNFNRTDSLIDCFDQIKIVKDFAKIFNNKIEPYYIFNPVIKNFLIAMYNSNNKG